MVTTRIRLGTLVASPNFRHPVPFAKELMTLDDICGGRLTVGIGAGGEGWDAAVLGHDPWTPAERAGRFTEFVELTDLVLRQPATSYQGRYYRADGARNIPGCVQQPRTPFAIAATGARGMQTVAKFAQMWVTTGDPAGGERLPAGAGVALVRSQMRLLDDACAQCGRDPSDIARMVLTGVQLDPGLGSAEGIPRRRGPLRRGGRHGLWHSLASS